VRCLQQQQRLPYGQQHAVVACKDSCHVLGRVAARLLASGPTRYTTTTSTSPLPPGSAGDGGQQLGRRGPHQAAQPGHAAGCAAGTWRLAAAGGPLAALRMGGSSGWGAPHTKSWRQARDVLTTPCAEPFLGLPLWVTAGPDLPTRPHPHLTPLSTRQQTPPSHPSPPHPTHTHSPLPQPVPAEWNAFCYVYEGRGRIGDKAAQPEHAYVLHNEGDTVRGRPPPVCAACWAAPRSSAALPAGLLAYVCCAAVCASRCALPAALRCGRLLVRDQP
jgi:hypothetical protein